MAIPSKSYFFIFAFTCATTRERVSPVFSLNDDISMVVMRCWRQVKDNQSGTAIFGDYRHLRRGIDHQ